MAIDPGSIPPGVALADACRRRFLAKTTASVLAASGLTAGCSVAALNARVPADTHRFLGGLVYGEDPRQRLDLYLPLGTPPAAGHPWVLFFYGGSWNRGDRADYRFVGEALASAGQACAVADYRLYPQVRYPDFLHDAAQAFAWLRAEANRGPLDPRRGTVAGHSAGAYNAAMLALDPRWLGAQGLHPRQLAGWAGLAGPYDFTPIGNREVQPVFHHPGVPRDSQPLAHAMDLSPPRPAFLGAPQNDFLVGTPRNSVALARALEAAGGRVWLKVYDSATHITLAAALAREHRWIAPVFADMLEFLDSLPPAEA